MVLQGSTRRFKDQQDVSRINFLKVSDASNSRHHKDKKRHVHSPIYPDRIDVLSCRPRDSGNHRGV
jgi:hypothetical protein